MFNQNPKIFHDLNIACDRWHSKSIDCFPWFQKVATRELVLLELWTWAFHNKTIHKHRTHFQNHTPRGNAQKQDNQKLATHSPQPSHTHKTHASKPQQNQGVDLQSDLSFFTYPRNHGILNRSTNGSVHLKQSTLKRPPRHDNQFLSTMIHFAPHHFPCRMWSKGLLYTTVSPEIQILGGRQKGKKINVIVEKQRNKTATVRQKLTSSKKEEDFQKQTTSLHHRVKMIVPVTKKNSWRSSILYMKLTSENTAYFTFKKKS